MNWRLGLVDVCAILLLLVVLFMPPQNLSIIGAFDHRSQGDKARDVGFELARAERLQTELYSDPGNGAVAERYAAIMSDLGRHDMALRIGGAAAQVPSPTTWRAQASVSSAFADRIDVENSLLWAERAMQSCKQIGAKACPPHERVRLRLYLEQLQLGIKVLAKGVDPKFDPYGFSKELSRAHPTTRTGKSESR